MQWSIEATYDLMTSSGTLATPVSQSLPASQNRMRFSFLAIKTRVLVGIYPLVI